jgi:hypothetical protein
VCDIWQLNYVLAVEGGKPDKDKNERARQLIFRLKKVGHAL